MEDIYFFQVNTKYISSSVLKHQNFHEMKYIGIYKKINILFILYFLKATCNVSPTEKGLLKMQKRKMLANPNSFGTKIFVTR